MLKVLAIDDDSSLLDVLSLSLKQQGFQVLTALQGEEGIKIAKAEHPDIILLDLILTDIPGLEVLNKIKESEETADIPIVMLTSYGNPKVEAEAKNLGISGYLFKYQVKMEDIGLYIRDLLGKVGTVSAETSK